MSHFHSRRMLGGEFEMGDLNLAPADRLVELTHHRQGTWTHSGRAALALWLRAWQAQGGRHVHLPAYLCESLLQPVLALGLEYSFYPVDADLVAHPDPPPGAVVVLVHYFGWPNPATSALRSPGLPVQLLEDMSHMLFSDWGTLSPEASLFFSARKFGPALLGGWCSYPAPMIPASQEMVALTWRLLAARLARGTYLAKPAAEPNPVIEAFYLEAFRAVEISLDVLPPEMAPPEVALETLAGLPWTEIAARRRANWQHLHQALAGRVSPLMGTLPENVTPLGYLIRIPDRDSVRQRLASQRIFCPVHWPLPGAVAPRQFPAAAELAQTLLTLPIDQRYGPQDMDYLAHTLLAAL